MARISRDDLTCVYYTSNRISDKFLEYTKLHLLDAIGDLEIVVVSQKPMDFGILSCNIVVGKHRSHVNIYRQALIGAKMAKTKYIALAEDDVLYAPEHFKYTPSDGKFAYNVGTWNLYTWNDPPLFSHKLGGRKNLHSLICERDLFIEAIEERFKKYPREEDVRIALWAEPGKYERQLGVTVRQTETFCTNPPNIMFSHEKALAFDNLGTRKRLGEIRAYHIPYWGSAEEIREHYE